MQCIWKEAIGSVQPGVEIISATMIILRPIFQQFEITTLYQGHFKTWCFKSNYVSESGKSHTCIVIHYLTDFLWKRMSLLDIICWNPTLQQLMHNIALGLVTRISGVPGCVRKWIQKASDRFFEWLWPKKKKDALWFMQCTSVDVSCEPNNFHRMNNSAIRSIVSSYLPCYCYFYVNTKVKINWCPK